MTKVNHVHVLTALCVGIIIRGIGTCSDEEQRGAGTLAVEPQPYIPFIPPKITTLSRSRAEKRRALPSNPTAGKRDETGRRCRIDSVGSAVRNYTSLSEGKETFLIYSSSVNVSFSTES